MSAHAFPDTRRRLLDAAAAVFAVDGPHGARMEDVARQAGTSRQTLYYHFGSRHELSRAVVRNGLERLGTQLRAQYVEDLDRPLTDIPLTCLQFYDAHRDLAQLLLGREMGIELHELTDLGSSHLVDPIAERLRHDVRAGQLAPLDPDITARSIIASINACALEWVVNSARAPAGVDTGHLLDPLEELVARMLTVRG